MCVCVHVHMLCAYVETRNRYCVSSSIFLHSVFLKQVSYWTCSLPFWLDWSVSPKDPHVSVSRCWESRGGTHTQLLCAFPPLLKHLCICVSLCVCKDMCHGENVTVRKSTGNWVCPFTIGVIDIELRLLDWAILPALLILFWGHEALNYWVTP